MDVSNNLKRGSSICFLLWKKTPNLNIHLEVGMLWGMGDVAK